MKIVFITLINKSKSSVQFILLALRPIIIILRNQNAFHLPKCCNNVKKKHA